MKKEELKGFNVLQNVRVFKASISKSKKYIILNVGCGILKNKNSKSDFKLWSTILINRNDTNTKIVKVAEKIGLALKKGEKINIDIIYKYMTYDVEDVNINVLINGVKDMQILESEKDKDTGELDNEESPF